MNPMKMKLLEELLSHLESSQGGDLKSMLDAEKSPMSHAEPDGDEECDEYGNPKGVKIEKVSVMGKPGMPDMDEDDKMKPLGAEMNKVSGMDEDEMSDDELAELLKKALA